MSELKKLSLYEKIQLVSDEIKNIEKDMTVGTGNYSYKAVSDLQVTLSVKAAEKKHRVVSIPFSQELVSSDVVKTIKKNGDEGITYVDNIKMTVRIFDLDSEAFIDIISFGKGIDTGDKGFGKASTYARKYALLNAYKIATGEDPDSDKSTEDIVPKTVSEKRKLVVQYLESNVDILNKALQHFGAESSDDLSDKDVNTLYSTYKKRNVL